MTTRNLTKKFKEFREASVSKLRTERLELGLEGDDNGMDSSLVNKSDVKPGEKPLSPQWVETIANAEHVMSQIKTRLKYLSTLHGKRLMVDFESDQVISY